MGDPYSTPPGTPASAGFDFNKPTVVALLYIVGTFTALPTLIGLFFAYAWKAETRGSWMEGHMRFHVRTFWYAVIASLLASLLWFIGLKWFGLILVGLYVAARSFLALMQAQKQAPVPDPRALFWQ